MQEHPTTPENPTKKKNKKPKSKQVIRRCDVLEDDEQCIQNLDSTNNDLQKIDLHKVYSCCQKLFDLLDEPKYKNMYVLQRSYELSQDYPQFIEFKHNHRGLWRGILTGEIHRDNFGHVEILLAQRSKMQHDQGMTIRDMDRQVMQGIHARREMMFQPQVDSEDSESDS